MNIHKNKIFSSISLILFIFARSLRAHEDCLLKELNYFEIKDKGQSLPEMLEMAQKNGFKGITIPRAILSKPEDQFISSWWHEFIFRFDSNDQYFVEIIASKQADARDKKLCADYEDEPGIQELRKSEDSNTFRILLISKVNTRCLGGAIVDMPTRVQPYVTLSALYIVPEYRSQGFANILLQKVSYLAWALHAQGIRLKPLPIGHIALDKENLIKWYEKKGFSYLDTPTKFNYMINKNLDFKPNLAEKVSIIF